MKTTTSQIRLPVVLLIHPLRAARTIPVPKPPSMLALLLRIIDTPTPCRDMHLPLRRHLVRGIAKIENGSFFFSIPFPFFSYLFSFSFYFSFLYFLLFLKRPIFVGWR
jgi:hypothetical protein